MATTWVTEPEAEFPIRMSSEGFGARTARTVVDVFKETVERSGHMPALFFKSVPAGTRDHSTVPFQSWTWDRYYDKCRAFAKALIHLGVEPHRITAILGFNSKEWFVANNGAILAGGIAAGIYATNLPDACQYITEHSRAEVVVVEGNAQLAKYREISHELPALKALVVYGDDEIDQSIADACSCSVYSFEDFLNLGNEVVDDDLEARMNAQRPGHCCTLIYTSGTTGPPKAVMISHDNVTWVSSSLLAHAVSFNETDRIISYLPLSHIAAQILDIHAPMLGGSQVYFAQPDALRGSLKTTLGEVHPTIFFGVPRVWEKFYEAMMVVARQTTGIKRTLADWAKARASEKTHYAQFGNGGGAPCGYGCAHMLVLGRVKAALGLDQVRACFTAAAPISADILNYFGSLDIPVYEVFGQSECTGPHTVSCEGQWKIGTCGRPLPGTESKLEAETGELCYRGRHIFMGYMYNPEKTAETIDDEGWLHSGDVAEFDADNRPDVIEPSGFLRITGRIKELIITAGGENIPPVLIENEIKSALPCVANAMVIGDKRKYLTVLLALKVEVDADSGLPANRLTAEALTTAQQIGSSATTTEEAAQDDAWTRHIEAGLAQANKAATSNAQKVQKFRFLPTDLSERGGELTPTLKLKRGPTAEKYEDLIESMYA